MENRAQGSLLAQHAALRDCCRAGLQPCELISRNIPRILSEWGSWGEELVGPLDAFDKRGYEVVFATSTGRRPVPLPPSEDPSFVDPPLGRTVTSEENARKTREVSESGRLDKPLNTEALDWQRGYIRVFLHAVARREGNPNPADRPAQENVIAAMKEYLPNDATLFLLDYELNETISHYLPS